MIQAVGFPKLPSDFEYDTEVHESFDREHSIFMNVFRRKKCEPTQVKRALLLVHGQGEHGGRYLHFPHYLQGIYDIILAVDLRGHGRSEGIRGHVERFDEYVDDALLAWEVLKKKCGTQTRFDLFGHSMGGLVALRMLMLKPDFEIQHAIISGPALGIKVEVPFAKELLARILAKVWGSFQLDTAIDATLLSHDPHSTEAYLKDRLVHSKATPLFYFAMVAALTEINEKSIRPKADTRILFQLAAEDQIIDFEAAKLFFENMKHEEKKQIIYPGLYHEIYFETSKELVFEDFVRFVERA